MKIPPNFLRTAAGAVSGLAAILSQGPARATDLVVADQSMLRFVCMFDPECGSRVLPTDIGALLTAQRGSDPRLQSFSFEARPGTPAAGTTMYVYRVDLTRQRGGECLAGMVIEFGPPAEVPRATADRAQVFVVTSEGNGTIPVKSAEQDGDFIQFNFDGPVCPRESSLYFGLASKNSPESGSAILFGYGSPPIRDAAAQAPKRD